MISQVNGTAPGSAYQKSAEATKTERQNGKIAVAQQGDSSKIDAIKEQIEKGEYRIDLDALAQKIADELI